MSTIVSLQHDGCIWMGTGTVVHNELNIVSNNELIFMNEEFLIGVSNSDEYSQYIQHCFSIPSHSSKLSVMQYFVSCFIKELKNSGITPTQSIVIGYRGIIFVITENFDIVVPKNNYVAIGKGSSVALGAFQVLRDIKDQAPIEKITRVLQATSEHCESLSTPYVIMGQQKHA